MFEKSLPYPESKKIQVVPKLLKSNFKISALKTNFLISKNYAKLFEAVISQGCFYFFLPLLHIFLYTFYTYFLYFYYSTSVTSICNTDANKQEKQITEKEQNMHFCMHTIK